MKTVMIFTFLFGLVAASTINRFQNALLYWHNWYRGQHGVPKLTLSSKVSSAAQKWAEHIAETGTFAFSSTVYGENWYYHHSSSVPSPESLAKKACDSWYSESKHYDYSNIGAQNTSQVLSYWFGAFTAMVWKDSTELGGGLATAADNWVYIVAFYNPAGNVFGKYSENVLKPQ